MNIDIFIEELRGRFLPLGKLNIATTTNIPGQPMPRIDDIWFIEATPSGIDVHIYDLQKSIPVVVVDVPSRLSLNYTLGTSTSDIISKASKEYAGMLQELASIKQYADLILDAYNVAVAYEKATVLFNQYYGTQKPELLKAAYNTLKGCVLFDLKCNQLLDAIKSTAKSNNIGLN